MTSLPQRPESHIIGTVGEKSTSLLFSKWGWTAEAIKEEDYGEDLHCTIFINRQRTNLYFRCQVKSRTIDSSYVRKLASGDFSVSVSTSTLRAWARSLFPTLLIVYDEEDDCLYWTNATKQILEDMSILAQDSATIRIFHNNKLNTSREQLLIEIQHFYEQLLRLTSPTIECLIYPLQMPHYRAPSPPSVYKLEEAIADHLSKTSADTINFEVFQETIETLPGWASSVKTLYGSPFIMGFQLGIENTSIHAFIDTLRGAVQSMNRQLKISSNNEWLAFVCSPPRLVASDGEDDTPLWNRELADWTTYSALGSDVVSDFEYAFSTPTGFHRAVRIRSMSWDGIHYINKETDVALSIFAPVVTTPGVRTQIAMHQEHLKRNFVPWTCKSSDLEDLSKQLSDSELTFRTSERFPTSGDNITGIICAPPFNPFLGLVSMGVSWEDFDSRSVMQILESSGLIGRLPGTLGPSVISDIVIDAMPGHYASIPDKFLISSAEHVPGMPIDHGGRVIRMQRYGLANEFNRLETSKTLELLHLELSKRLSGGLVDTDFEFIDDYKPILRISAAWRPHLLESTSASIRKHLELVATYFDRLLPTRHNETSELDSWQVLNFLGQLHFDLDEVPTDTERTTSR
ncbi:DUF4365 domain-containing protein [Sorangium sp. So ce854]|uniref:DUF4365 domain-containing protein n=1 Tax=Sorangium sp. So ce854 TaxID=3133322 RepID=UPI003F6293B2